MKLICFSILWMRTTNVLKLLSFRHFHSRCWTGYHLKMYPFFNRFPRHWRILETPCNTYRVTQKTFPVDKFWTVLNSSGVADFKIHINCLSWQLIDELDTYSAQTLETFYGGSPCIYVILIITHCLFTSLLIN